MSGEPTPSAIGQEAPGITATSNNSLIAPVEPDPLDEVAAPQVDDADAAPRLAVAPVSSSWSARPAKAPSRGSETVTIA